MDYAVSVWEKPPTLARSDRECAPRTTSTQCWPVWNMHSQRSRNSERMSRQGERKAGMFEGWVTTCAFMISADLEPTAQFPVHPTNGVDSGEVVFKEVSRCETLIQGESDDEPVWSVPRGTRASFCVAPLGAVNTSRFIVLTREEGVPNRRMVFCDRFPCDF